MDGETEVTFFDVPNATPPEAPGPLSISDLNKALDAVSCECLDELFPHTRQTVRFLVPFCRAHEISCAKRSDLESAIHRFGGETGAEVWIDEAEPHQLNIAGASAFPPTFRVCVYSARTRKVERVKDALKEVLYKPGASAKEDRFRLRGYGRFLSPKPPSQNDLLIHSFGHTFFYRYRLSKSRALLLPKNLHKYLTECIDDCPNGEFMKPPRCSAVCAKFGLNVRMHEDDPTGIREAIRNMPAERVLKSQHEHLQKYLLDTDAASVACEAPVWLFGSEFGVPLPVLPDDVLTGHIDLIRYNDGKIWVWDFKPNAAREKHAGQQVYLYSLMLAKRAGVPIEDIRCGYFDRSDAFWFEPGEVRF